MAHSEPFDDASSDVSTTVFIKLTHPRSVTIQPTTFSGTNTTKRVGANNENKRKRSNAHLLYHEPATKVFLGKYHEICRVNTFLNETVPRARKRARKQLTTASARFCGKLPKSNIEDDVEEMRKKFEQWDNKENTDVTKEPPRMWHIDAYIEQNVYDTEESRRDNTERESATSASWASS